MAETFKADIAVIGAGITGTAIARRLSQYKLAVLVIEKEADVGWGTTKANSGLLHPGYVGEEGTIRLSTCQPGSMLFRKHAPELDIPLKNSGSLLNILDQGQIKDLEDFIAKGKKYGVKGLKILKNKDSFLRSIEPNLSDRVIASLYCSEHYYTSPYEAAIALFENARQNGVCFLFSQKVNKIDYDSQRKKFLIAASLPAKAAGASPIIESEYVVNAAGVHADEVSHMIGDFSYSIQPFKSQYYLLDTEAGNLVKRPNIMHPQKGQTRTKNMIVGPTIDGNVLVGSNYEESSKEALHTSFEGLRQIKEHLSMMIDNIPFDQVITTFSGIRACADSGDFVLGPSKANEKFIHAAGIQSPGLTCAFIIAEMIEEHLKAKGLKAVKDPKFCPVRKRFQALDTNDYLSNNRLYENDQDWAEIVCRCEKVTKAQIVDAIRRGATSLDGIKFRTRAGMGRCQGGYCSLKIMEIVSKETGIPLDQVTKSGRDSFLARSKL